MSWPSQVSALAIPTPHNRNKKGGTQNRQKCCGQIRRHKLQAQPDLPIKEKSMINDSTHRRRTKVKINPEKPKTRMSK
jgi:hypothetical protein